jgi:hypothetical protein
MCERCVWLVESSVWTDLLCRHDLCNADSIVYGKIPKTHMLASDDLLGATTIADFEHPLCENTPGAHQGLCVIDPKVERFDPALETFEPIGMTNE